MEIIPFVDKIWLKLDTMKLGGIDLTGQNLVSEVGTVVARHDSCSFFNIGDKVYFKAWGADHTQINGEDYYILDINSKAILGKKNV